MQRPLESLQVIALDHFKNEKSGFFEAKCKEMRGDTILVHIFSSIFPLNTLLTSHLYRCHAQTSTGLPSSLRTTGLKTCMLMCL